MTENTFAGRWQRVGRIAELPLVAIGLAAFAFAPLPLALLGALGFAVAAALRPWIVVPIVVLTLPYYLHPRTFGGIEVSLTEAAILLGLLGVVGRVAAERLITPHPSECPATAGLGVRRADNPPPQGGRDPAPNFPPQGGREHTPSPLMGEGGGGGSALRLPTASPIDWAVAAMLLAGLLSLLVTEYPKQSLRELRWLIIEPLIVFYIARATLTTPRQLNVVLWSLVASGVVAALIALGSLGLQGVLADPLARATGPYLSPNHLGLFLGRAGAVALALALFAPGFDQSRAKGRTVAWFMLAVIACGLLRTISLGAWAGLAAAGLALTAMLGRRWLAATVLSLALVLFAALAVLPPGRTTGRLDPTSGTALFRVQIWAASLHMIADHPVLGVGLDNFLYRYRDGYMLPEAAEEPNISHPHNWLLNFWLELGILGLAAALGVLAWVGATAWKLLRTPSSENDRLLGAATIGIFVATLVHGSLDNSYFLVDAAVLWWLFVALLARATSSGPPSPPSLRPVE